MLDGVASKGSKDNDADGYSLHYFLCGWPGVDTKLVSKLGCSLFAAMAAADSRSGYVHA